MASLIKLDHETRFAMFHIEDAAELTKLPTTVNYGKSELSIYPPVMQGSCAKTPDGKFYKLHSDGTWGEASGGGGGGGGSIDYASDDDVKDIFGL